MKKLFFFPLLLGLLITASSSFAQTPKAAVIHYDKADHQGLVISYPFSEKVVEDALRNRFDKAGFSKRHTKKGFDVYQGQNWDEVSAKQVDVYTKVDGNRSSSTISLLVSKGYDNNVTQSSDSAMFNKLEVFMSSLLNDILQVQLLEDIKSQEDVVKNAQKDYDREVDNGNKLQKDKERIEKDIANSAAQQQTLNKALSDQMVKLESMKAKVGK